MRVKKLLCSILAVCMVLSSMGFTAFAKPESPVAPAEEGISLAGIDENGNVAEINGVGYATIQEAIDAAASGDTVTVAAGEYNGFDISDKKITIQGTVSDNGELLTTIKGGNPAITAHNFNGTIKDLNIADAWEAMYAEPAGNVTVDNVCVTGATYGFHLVAYTTGLEWTIQNSYMDLCWANSFGVYGGDAKIVIKNNKFDSTNPYYPNYGALAVNTFLPNVTVEENIFGECTRIYIDASVTDTSNINIGANYYADGVENAFADDDDGVKVAIDSYYVGIKENDELTGLVDTSKTYVASVKNEAGDMTCYETLAAAIENAAEGDTIEILEDITIVQGETLRLNNVKLAAAEGVSVTNNGVISVGGESTISFPVYSGESVDFSDGAIIVDSYINGSVFVAGNVTFRGKNTFAMLYDYGTLTDYYGTTANMEWTVEPGSSVTLSNTARYGLGYGDNVTVNGNIANALTARAALTDDDASLFMHGLVGQESKGWNCNSTLTVSNAYVKIGSNNSFGNKPGNYGGTYTYNINNSVVDSSRITFYEAVSTSTFNITKSDVKMGTFMTNDADSEFNITDSVVLSESTSNGTDEGNYNAGKLNLYNSKLTYSAPVRNNGEIKIDVSSKFTAPKITGSGVITIDAKDYDGYSEVSLFDADMTGFSGTYNVINSDFAKVVIDANGNVILASNPVGGPLSAYTSENAIWGETRANAKESYVLKVYSEDTYMGEAKLVDVLGDMFDGDVTVTWNIPLNGNSDEWWNVTWAITPSMDCQPTHVELWIDGVSVNRAKIQLNGPDNLKKICAAVTDADGKILSYATSLKDAFNNVSNGGRVELLCDVELSSAIAFAKDIAVTLDGNGYTIKPAKGSKEANSAFNFGQGNDSTRATRKYNIENVVFEGWTTDHVVRIQGTTSVISNCTFINNNQPDGLGLVTITFADVTVDSCTFKNNVCVECIDVNSWGDDSASNSVVDNCLFEDNTVSGPGVIYYNDGASLTVTDNKYVSNTVNTTGNAATLYMGFNGGSVVKGNLFKNNTVATTLDRTTRVAGAVFAGFADDNCAISGNVFDNNTATANGNAAASGVAYSAYYGAGNLDGNYWGGNEPVMGVDYTHEYPTSNDLTVEEYYGEYSIDVDGNLVVADLKSVVSKVVAVQYVENKELSDADNGLKVYDIVIVAKDEHIINRLNTADLTFVSSSDKIVYEVVAAENITLTHNTDYPNRYMFNFNGKDNVEDTAVAITIGTVRFTGYDAFTFQIADAETNLVTATTIDDNIVSYYSASGLVLNTDTDGDGKYEGIVDTEIAVPTRTLKITVDFPNAVEDNAIAYQDMKVEITGNFDGVSKTVTYNLGEDEVAMIGGSYVVEDANLVLNETYTVAVSGAGYRTARYTVTMTDDKQLNFWNNVMDEAQVVEIGKDSSKANVTFLAGDIVKDSQINIYDLSAVVSYFGTENATDEACTYAKYDLNRDGVIDSKDVAYVLVSWNN